jgi:hypothetical protein
MEVVVAVALSAALLILVAATINLYLLESDSDRMRVEQAQLARAVLDMIADDVRNTYVHQPLQLTTLASQIQSAAASGGEDGEEGGGGAGGGGDGSGGGGAAGGGGGTGGGGGGGGAGGGTSQTGGTTGATAAEDLTPMPGVYGLVDELTVDIQRIPGIRQRNPIENGQQLRSAVRSVHWFIRAGERVPATSLATTALRPDDQLRIAGLVRQEIDRTARVLTQLSGGDLLTDAPAILVAPEVTQIELRYFSGIEWLDRWDMVETQALPRAVEIRIWIEPPTVVDIDDGEIQETLGPNNGLLEFSLTVDLPMVSEPVDTTATGTSATGTSTTGGGGAG